MKTELTTLQLTGILISIVGLLLSNGLFIYSCYIIKKKLNENDRKQAIIRPFNLYFQFRKLIKGTSNGSDRKNYEKILSFLHWSMFITVGMIIIGILLAMIS